jgi:secondary thiamine-phosphate synthase enzyme
MRQWSTRVQVDTDGRGFFALEGQLREALAAAGIRSGLLHVFLCHTSASLVVTENADPDVLRDLETIMSRLGPDGDPAYRHRLEGPDDMAAHVRSVLTLTELTLPVRGGRLALGTWQGVFLWEHRHRGHRRDLEITVFGD